MTVPITKFGKDHWSTFAYIECRAVDHQGRLVNEHLRCNPHKHPDRAHRGGWLEEHSTRLRDGTIEAGSDDWSCITDLVYAGLVRSSSTGKDWRFSLTADGWALVSKLRRWKAQGGTFATFDPDWSP